MLSVSLQPEGTWIGIQEISPLNGFCRPTNGLRYASSFTVLTKNGSTHCTKAIRCNLNIRGNRLRSSGAQDFAHEGRNLTGSFCSLSTGRTHLFDFRFLHRSASKVTTEMECSLIVRVKDVPAAMAVVMICTTSGLVKSFDAFNSLAFRVSRRARFAT